MLVPDKLNERDMLLRTMVLLLPLRSKTDPSRHVLRWVSSYIVCNNGVSNIVERDSMPVIC